MQDSNSSNRDGNPTKSSCHLDPSPAVDGEPHCPGRVSELFCEPRHEDVLLDAFVQLFKLNKPNLLKLSMSSTMWQWAYKKNVSSNSFHQFYEDTFVQASWR